VTIGIGILCDSGNAIILLADTRATSAQTHNDSCSKIYDLAHDHYCVIAGDISWAGQLASEFDHRMKLLKRIKLVPQRVKKEYQQSRLQVATEVADATLQNTLNITFETLKTDPSLTPSVRNRGIEIVQQIVPDYASIVGGFDKNAGPVFFCSMFNGLVMENSSPGYFAIGSGGNLAYDYLSHRGQETHMSLPQSLFHAIEARIFARIDAGVGGIAGIIVLSKKNKPLPVHLHPAHASWVRERLAKSKTDYLGTDVEKNIFAQTFGFQF
jgi:20S proteasome alpha/beta subunit